MKSSLKLLALGLLLLAPFSAAHAQAPSLSTIPDVTLNADATATVNVVAVDVGGRAITLTASLPSFATLNQPTTGTGVVVTTITLAPSSANITTYTGAVTATAGGAASTRTFQITINAAGSDQAPVVSAPALQDGTVGSSLGFTVNASDPDGDAISLNASGIPTGATFLTDGTDMSGTFSWTPGTGQGGEYDVMFTASNSLSGAALTHIHVEEAVTVSITPIDDVTVAETADASVPVSAAGMPGAMVILTASLPPFATLNPPGTGTGSVNTTITVSPPAGSTGTHHASVTATSLGVSVTEEFDIIVTGGSGTENHAPVLSAPANETVDVEETLSFDVTATDADGDHVQLSGSALPPGSGFVDNGINTGTFTWTPTAGQEGTYQASFTGNDNRGGTGNATTTITVSEGGVHENHAPTLSAPSMLQVTEGVNLSFTVTASDQDGDHVSLWADGEPSGASFSDQGDNSGAFSWTPGSTQLGVFQVTFTGDDMHGGMGTATTTITVVEAGGGGGAEVPGKACLVGEFKTKSENTCFLIRPVNGSFDLGKVDLSSITLKFHGESIAALNGKFELECRRVGGHDGDDDHGGGGGGHDGDDDHGGGGGGHDGDDDHGRGHDGHDGDRHGDKDKRHHRPHDAGAFLLGGDHPRGDDCDDDCGISCGDDIGHNDVGDCGPGSVQCDTLAIRACFSTQALRTLFAGATLPCDLIHAEIHATLTGGDTVVATFGDRHDDGDKDKGKDKDKDRDKDKDKGHGERDHRFLHPRTRPNPLNPMTELSFTMSREGRVRVSVYDMQGRLVNTLLDEVRAVGEQKVAWNGSNARNQKVASGVYFFRIQAPEGEVIQRVAVVK